MAEKNDDMYGPVEDQGWDPDGGTPITVRNGINRQRQELNIMDMVAKPAGDQYRKPKAQVKNLDNAKGRGYD